MKRRWIIAIAIVPVLLGAFAVTDRLAYDRAAWIADFDQLKTEIEHSYANLKWAAPAKGVDVVALNRATLDALDYARSQSEARRVLTDFISRFDDAHFHIESGPPRPVAALMALLPPGREPRIDFLMTPAEVCEALGYNHKRGFIRIDHPRLHENPKTTFATGTLTLKNGGQFGIIRIPAFIEHDYGAACEQAWDAFRAGRTGLCDQNCQDGFSIDAKHEVATELAREARELGRAAPDGIVIDLTGNGGGTEWSEYAAAALTPIPLKPPRLAFVRGEHWANQLTGALQDSARTPCDLSDIWKSMTFAPRCWNVVVMPPADSSDLSLVSQARPYRGKLFVMVNGNTASAAEYFAAVLQDNHAATIIGTRTMGVGCGYTNGGIDIMLKRSRLTVRMPDCARLRADGSNEYLGIRPDVLVDWGASESAKGVALEQALGGLLH